MRIKINISTAPPTAKNRVEQPEQHLREGLPQTVYSRLLTPFQDASFGPGLLLLLLSGAIYLLDDLFGNTRGPGRDNSLMIMIHYSLFLIYSFVLYGHGYFETWLPDASRQRPSRWLALLLWLISAYALNREFPVFQESTPWLCWVLVSTGAAMIGYSWIDVMPVRMQQLLYLMLAFGWWLFAYMAIYVAQLYPISIPLLIGLGLSCHTFVPVVFAYVLGKRLWHDARQHEHLRPAVVTGLAMPLAALGLFLTSWVRDVNRIDQIQLEATIRQTSDLPDWVLLAQQLKPGWVTNRLLLAGRVFDRGPFSTGNGWGISHLTNLDDVRQHDPLVVVASQLVGNNGLAEDATLKLIKTISQDRHNSEKKYWTGRHLTIEDVVSQVRIWPQFRLSYTEKTIRIRNQAQWSTEEALLTFHLPAGSVVSSMSLWVNGREEPARLTTVAKADTAYRTIVGVDSRHFARDPSLVSWQEGNRVIVRVFPCRAGEDRRVKIGITSPLEQHGDESVYQNPYFEGPNTRSTSELVEIAFAQHAQGVKSPWLFETMVGEKLTHQGRYDPAWTLRFTTPTLSAAAFVMPDHKQAYRLEPYKPVQEPFLPTDVYLDINAAWTQEEFQTACQVANQSGSQLWIFDDGLKQLATADARALYQRLSRQQFSLFPIYRIPNPATALLISKGTAYSPTLSDLKNTTFADRMQQAASQPTSIRTFCFGNELSSYLKTLAELRVLSIAQGTPDDLNQLVKQHQFPQALTVPDKIALPGAGVVVHALKQPKQTAGQPATAFPTSSEAPDHLARLFVYNQLLQQIGRHYFAPNYQTDTLIQLAQQAHVVSPLSSLVVLETENDYDRFNIKKDNSGLDNATLKQEGAVPEPHEWTLLALITLVVGWLIWKKRYAVA